MLRDSVLAKQFRLPCEGFTEQTRGFNGFVHGHCCLAGGNFRRGRCKDGDSLVVGELSVNEPDVACYTKDYKKQHEWSVHGNSVYYQWDTLHVELTILSLHLIFIIILVKDR